MNSMMNNGMEILSMSC